MKLRDAAQMMADAAAEQLEKMAPIEVKSSWDPSKIAWREAQGTKGPYERYPGENEKAESTEDYRLMLADLKEHKDKLTRSDYFYWLFRDSATVGRKKRK